MQFFGKNKYLLSEIVMKFFLGLMKNFQLYVFTLFYSIRNCFFSNWVIYEVISFAYLAIAWL